MQVLLSSLSLDFDFETDYTGSYSTLCNVVDNGQLINTSRYVPNGGYYIVEYDVVLAFGLTELAAQYAWKENGVEKRCPAKITYDFQ
ncbi:hypothetical protein PISMIDRAFT_685495 [Pisolithus microcarpus 441]|uniref:Unplaced genomic scaffold scaffold_151, whole genome shotgun sequence n=1 Tax=Pisolithus microcarpus 441 TaxID=765257 RepID=A0A0C9XXK1_9AGAM|nr:hypothetical protein PISMIDRAFT_685495 [Pisolithus microcarpus 441]